MGNGVRPEEKYLRWERRSGLWVFLFSMLFFTICLGFMPDSVRQKSCSDCEGWYLPVAENLVAGNGLEVGVEKRPALDRPPGQVVLLAGLFWVLPTTLVDRETAVYAYNILLLALSCLFLFSISKVYWGERLALLTAAAWMSCPFVLWFLNQAYSEVPFFLALFFAAWMMLKSTNKRISRYQLLCVGVALGVATLIRPIGVALVIPFLISFWIEHRPTACSSRIIGAVFLLFGYIATLTPWHVYLYEQKGEFVFLSDGVHASRSIEEGLIFGLRSKAYKTEINLASEVREFMEEVYAIIYRPQEDIGSLKIGSPSNVHNSPSTQQLIQTVYERFVDDPILALRFVGLKLSRSWYGTDSHRNEDISRVLISGYLVLTICGFWSVIKKSHTRRLGLFVLIITLYFWLFAFLFTPLVRYMIPALGLHFLIIPAIINWSYRRKRFLRDGNKRGGRISSTITR